MSLSNLSVHRPVFTTMVVLIVLILGGISLFRLPVDLMPDISIPTISISTNYGNAGPEEMEELVTRPIEEALSAVPGVQEITSSSSEGNSDIRVSFAWGTDLDAASNDIRDRLDRVVSRLPDDASKPVLRKFDIASFPVLILGAYGNLDPVQLRRTIDDQVKYRIERVPGVASLDIRGGRDREIHIELNAGRINALGLSIDSIISRIKAENVTKPAGTIKRGNYEILIRVPGEYSSLDDIRNVTVAYRNGEPVLLKEISEVKDSWQRVTQVVRVNGQTGVRLSVSKQSGMNTVEVAKAALAEIDKINEELPQIHIVPISDTSKYIERSINNVGSSAMYGGALAVLVLLFFLRNILSTLVIATAIPVSIIATFTLMYFCGFTLNIMTLGGLALGVGMLVDNSIVVLENIFRIREGGVPAEEAATSGTDEVVAAVVSSTLTTVAVFLPLLFVRGMAGIMFKQLAIVVSFALLCSLVVALTVVPMLAARLLRKLPSGDRSHESIFRKFYRLSGMMFTGLESAYKDLLRVSLNHRFVVIFVVVALLAGSVVMIPLVGTEMMPAADEGEVRVTAELEVGSKLEASDAKLRQIEEIVKANIPEAISTVASTGGGGHDGGSSADMNISLKPLAERTRSSEQVASDLRKKLAGIAGITIRTRAGQGLFILRMGSSSERVQVEIRGHDLAMADDLAARVKKIVENVDGVTDVSVSRQTGNREELVVVDRQKAADMKLTVTQVAEFMESLMSGASAGNYREGGDEYAIVVQLANAETAKLDEILNLTLNNADGKPVVLRNVVSVKQRTGPVRIERKDQERLLTVSANIADRDLGSILEDVRKGLAAIAVPSEFSVAFGGDYEEQQKAFRELLLGLILALILVYMVMACQYESLRDPFVVMFSVPLGIIGVVLMLFLTGTTFNIQSYIGCIILGGIVVNNAILLVDHTNLLRRRDGMPLRAAIEEAGRRRLRPILMTASTTILGLLPLALGLGEGGEAQAPMARAVIGGMASSTLFTLVFVPVMYSIFEWRSKEEKPEPSEQ
ncbi:MAG: efflux RND transporter permease subunit [Candidatus Brocadiia bacterium]